MIFFDSSNAGNAFIDSDGSIVIEEQASGGTGPHQAERRRLPRYVRAHDVRDNGRFDRRQRHGQAWQLNLAVGGNDLSTIFDGVIQDGGSAGGTGGSLTKEGKGSLTLTASAPIQGRPRSMAAR